MTDDLKERLRPPGRSVISKCADVDGADLSNVPLTYERIWLQSDGGDGVTWCQHPQDDEDVPYVRADFYAASLARITDLESRLAAAEADRDKAREYAAQARIRENKAEDARVSAVDRATRAEAENTRLKRQVETLKTEWGIADRDRIKAEAGEDALAECLRRLLKGDSYRAHSEAALAAYEARRKG